MQNKYYLKIKVTHCQSGKSCIAMAYDTKNFVKTKFGKTFRKHSGMQAVDYPHYSFELIEGEYKC